MLLTVDLNQTEKRTNTISQMRMSILNTATTEQMGQGIVSFFVCSKSTNQERSFDRAIVIPLYFTLSLSISPLPDAR